MRVRDHGEQSSGHSGARIVVPDRTNGLDASVVVMAEAEVVVVVEATATAAAK